MKASALKAKVLEFVKILRTHVICVKGFASSKRCILDYFGQWQDLISSSTKSLQNLSPNILIDVND
jgi:hypothetical protein